MNRKYWLLIVLLLALSACTQDQLSTVTTSNQIMQDALVVSEGLEDFKQSYDQSVAIIKQKVDAGHFTDEEVDLLVSAREFTDAGIELAEELADQSSNPRYAFLSNPDKTQRIFQYFSMGYTQALAVIGPKLQDRFYFSPMERILIEDFHSAVGSYNRALVLLSGKPDNDQQVGTAELISVGMQVLKTGLKLAAFL